jgi:phosphoribosylamine---glycine ligase
MKTLVLGSGGREAALVWALSRARSVSEVIAAPGNPGMEEHATTLPADASNVFQVVELVRRLQPGLVVVGPEAPLAAGVADALTGIGCRVFGPAASAARIEASKGFAKEVMRQAGVPTGSAGVFADPHDAVAYMDDLGPPYVIKADGLAAGKGVVVTEDRDEAVDAIHQRLVSGTFGDAGRTILVEQFLEGREASLIAFTDGKTVVPCQPARDYKRAHDGDRGANTGGMGSYSPVPDCPPELAARITEEILTPVVRALSEAGAPFVGALYAGVVLTDDGPKVIEFNARFGDPETQALLPRLESDFGELCLASTSGELEGHEISWSRDVCVAVVLASGGYPGPHATGLPITGLDRAGSHPGVHIFHAGTAKTDGTLVTAGGRVLAVSARAASFSEARSRAYAAAAEIRFDGTEMRSDIAFHPAEEEMLFRSLHAHPSFRGRGRQDLTPAERLGGSPR